MYVRYALFNIHVIYARYDIGKKGIIYPITGYEGPDGE